MSSRSETLLLLHAPCRYNQKALSLDFLELLERFIPTEYEMRLIGGYEGEGRPLDELSEEDRFMVRFSKIPRLPQHISTLTFMGNFPDSVQLMQPVRSQSHDPSQGEVGVGVGEVSDGVSYACCLSASNWTPSSLPPRRSSHPAS